MNATDQLRKLLDEFEHECFMLRVEASETRARADVVRDSYERIRDEFAGRIAATLGTPISADLRTALDFMRIWITDDAHLGESAISRELEKAEGLRKLDAIEQAIAATLGADNTPSTEWGRIITGLIAAHYDNDEKRFKERAVKAAKMYDEAGKYEVAEYIMAQYSPGMAFIPM